MGLSGQMRCRLVVVICLSLSTALSASTFISDVVFGSSVLSERRLLQVKKPCPVNFEFQNYTVVTSRCRGPQYPPNLCCAAFKDFACPFADQLNDLTTDCASTMFSYLDLYGQYPLGLFAAECHDGKDGLECPPQPPSPSQSERVNSNYGSHMTCDILPVLLLMAVSVVSSLQFI